jgi:hypothetical protein
LVVEMGAREFIEFDEAEKVFTSGRNRIFDEADFRQSRQPVAFDYFALRLLSPLTE